MASRSAGSRRKRRTFEKTFQAKVALSAVRGDKTLSELAGQFDVHANQVSAWRQTLVDRSAELFEDGRRRKPDDDDSASQEEHYGHAAGKRHRRRKEQCSAQSRRRSP